MKTPFIIGLAGPKGVGKTTVADALEEEAVRIGLTVRRISFATPLKDMMRALYRYAGMSDRHIEMALTTQKEVQSALLNDRTSRHAMQTLGTEWGRECIGPDFWVDLAMEVAHQEPVPNLVIIDDARFRSEFLAIQDRGGDNVLIDRSGVHYTGEHASEMVPSPDEYAFRAGNNGTPRSTARAILSKFGYKLDA